MAEQFCKPKAEEESGQRKWEGENKDSRICQVRGSFFCGASLLSQTSFVPQAPLFPSCWVSGGGEYFFLAGTFPGCSFCYFQSICLISLGPLGLFLCPCWCLQLVSDVSALPSSAMKISPMPILTVHTRQRPQCPLLASCFLASGQFSFQETVSYPNRSFQREFCDTKVQRHRDQVLCSETLL